MPAVLLAVPALLVSPTLVVIAKIVDPVKIVALVRSVVPVRSADPVRIVDLVEATVATTTARLPLLPPLRVEVMLLAPLLESVDLVVVEVVVEDADLADPVVPLALTPLTLVASPPTVREVLPTPTVVDLVDLASPVSPVVMDLASPVSPVSPVKVDNNVMAETVAVMDPVEDPAMDNNATVETVVDVDPVDPAPTLAPLLLVEMLPALLPLNKNKAITCG